MTEEHGSYHTPQTEHDDLDGIERIGELLPHIIDEHGRPIPPGPAETNGGPQTATSPDYLTP